MWVCKYVHICVFCPRGTCCTVPLTQTVWAGEGLPRGVDSSPRACSAPPTGQCGTTSQLHFLKLARFRWGLQFSLLHQGKCFLRLYLDSIYLQECSVSPLYYSAEAFDIYTNFIHMMHQLIFCYTLVLYLVGFQTVHLQRKYLTTY